MEEARRRTAWRYWGQRRIWQLLSLGAAFGLSGLAYAEQPPVDNTATVIPQQVDGQWVPQGGEFSTQRPIRSEPKGRHQQKPLTPHRHTKNSHSAQWIAKGTEFSGASVTSVKKSAYDQKTLTSMPQAVHKPQRNAQALKVVAIRQKQSGPGRSLSQKPGQQFLRYPLQFTRISSEFSPARFHPIMKRTRPHLGVDFAAPRGTPVRAIADGTVQHAGWRGGLGRFVRLDHPGPHGSGYGHLHRIAKGVRAGSMVKQGQVIGYVGSTGLATGPHLHYVLYKHGKYINPLRKQLPRTEAPVRLAKPVQHKQLTQVRLR